MEQLAEGVFRLRGFPPDAVNVYVIGDVLLDAGTVRARPRILAQTAGWRLAAHALTHAPPDHFGSSRAVCDALGLPLWCPAGDVPIVERGDLSGLGRVASVLPWPPGRRVDRPLREGDEVGGFRVLETPATARGTARTGARRNAC
jgi:hydroxyacylglutathione hydrolase